MEIRGSAWTLEAQCAIEAIGNAPDEKARKLYPSVAVNRSRLILTDEKNCRTSRKGIFAGGDIIRGSDLVVRRSGTADRCPSRRYRTSSEKPAQAGDTRSRATAGA